MIFVVYDHTKHSYVPVYWVLMSSKSALAYDQTFQAIKHDLNGAFKPWVIGIDFEIAFLKMAGKHWPEANLIGCYFHFSQAFVKKMKDDLGFPKEIITPVLKIIQLATVLPQEDLVEITGKGWAYIADKIDGISVDEDVDEWMQSDQWKSMKADLFAYIRDFWIRCDVLPLWNCSAFVELDDDEQPIFRTNCWLESYNRKVNEMFPTAHPTMAAFAARLREEQQRIIQLQEDYRQRRESPPVYDPVQWPVVPADYATFEVQEGAWILTIAQDERPKKKSRKGRKRN